jgi:hypothetical protein
MRRSGETAAALRACALALVYLFVAQISLSPLATLRMEATASIFGVRCLPMADGAPQDDGAAHGACCDASCLLHAQSASAPPPAAALALVPPVLFARTLERSPTHEDAPRRTRGLRPQSQRAPPFA